MPIPLAAGASDLPKKKAELNRRGIAMLLPSVGARPIGTM